MPTWARGFDASFSQASPDWCRRRWADGYRVAGQDLWTGGYLGNKELRAVAGDNLRNYREVGFKTIGYINANPWFPAGLCITEAETNAGDDGEGWRLLDALALDVEIEGVAEAHIRGLWEALAGENKPLCLYTRKGFWQALGNPRWEWLRGSKLWNAWYDSDQDIDFPANPYGLWTATDLMGEQYQGTTDIEGVLVDLNIFDLDFFGEGENVSEIEDLSRLRRDIEELERRMGDMEGSGDFQDSEIVRAHNRIEGLTAIVDKLDRRQEQAGAALKGE